MYLGRYMVAAYIYDIISTKIENYSIGGTVELYASHLLARTHPDYL